MAGRCVLYALHKARIYLLLFNVFVQTDGYTPEDSPSFQGAVLVLKPKGSLVQNLGHNQVISSANKAHLTNPSALWICSNDIKPPKNLSSQGLLLGSDVSFSLCPQQAEEFHVELASAIIKASHWKAFTLISDTISLDIQSTFDLTHFSCDSQSEIIVMHLSQIHTGVEDLLNVVVDCGPNITWGLLERVCHGKELRYRYINWLLMGVGITSRPDVFQDCSRPQDQVVMYDFMAIEKPAAAWAKSLSPTKSPASGVSVFSLRLPYHHCSGTCFTDLRTSWTGPDRTLALLDSHFSGFGGRQLLVAAESYPPFFDWDDEGNLKGVDVEILKTLASRLNFTYKIVRPPDEKWGSQRADGSWNGMIGMVNRGEVDFAIAGISITYQRSTAVDYTFAYHIEPSAVAIKVTTNRWTYFIRALKWNLFLAFFIAPLFLSLLIWGVELMWPRCGSVSAPNVGQDELISLHDQIWKLLDIYGRLGKKLITVGSLLPKSYPLARPSDITLLACVVVVWAVYTGNLTASFAVQRIDWPFTDLHGLAQADDYTLLIAEGTVREDLFRESTHGTYKQLWEKYNQHNIRHSENDDLMAILRAGEIKAAFTADLTDIMKRRVVGDCDILMLRETYFPVGFGFPLPHGAVYKKHFDAVIHDLLQTGLIDRWYYRNLPQMPWNMCSEVGQGSVKPLQLFDILYIICYVLTVGLGTALWFLLIEILIYRYYQGKQLRKYASISHNGPTTRF